MLKLPHPTTDIINNALVEYAKKPCEKHMAFLLKAISNLLQENANVLIPTGGNAKPGELLLQTRSTEDGKEYVLAYSSEVELQLATPKPSYIEAPLVNYLEAIQQMDVAGLIFNPEMENAVSLEKEMLDNLLLFHKGGLMKNGISVQKADITTIPCDAVVNAANNTLLGGGGVDGAIHKEAGPELLEECRLYNGCPTGDVRLTRGYGLLAPYIIHTVGPVYSEHPDDAPVILADCYYNSLELARKHHLHSICFPAISTGVYGYPMEEACKVAMMTLVAWLTDHQDYGMEIILSCYNPAIYDIYQRIVKEAEKNSK